jgi:hypothetical protein
MTEHNAISVPELYSVIGPYLLDLLQSAPRYGFCGLDIVFHDGKPVKIEKRCGVTFKPEDTIPKDVVLINQGQKP